MNIAVSGASTEMIKGVSTGSMLSGASSEETVLVLGTSSEGTVSGASTAGFVKSDESTCMYHMYHFSVYDEQHQKRKTSLDLLKQEIVSDSGISWAICKSAPHPTQITTPAPHHSVSDVVI